MKTADAKNSNVVSIVFDVNTDVNGFSHQKVVHKAARFLNNDPTIKPTDALRNKKFFKLVMQALRDKEFFDLVLAVLRKEKTTVQKDDPQNRISQIEEAKQRIREELKLPTVPSAIPEPKGEDKEALISKVKEYQKKYCGAPVPDFTFGSLDLAAAWRWSLVEIIMDLQYFLDFVDKSSPDWMIIIAKIRYLRQYINAADAVLVRYHRVSVRYRTNADMLDKVANLLGGVYREYQVLVDDMDKTIDICQQKYGHRANMNLN